MESKEISWWTIPALEIMNDKQWCNRIIELCADNVGIKDEDILKRTRKRNICEARQVAAYVLRNTTGMSLETIGKRLNIDHATVYHSGKHVKDLMEYDKIFVANWQKILEMKRPEPTFE